VKEISNLAEITKLHSHHTRKFGYMNSVYLVATNSQFASQNIKTQTVVQD